jgi:hypothetical protein
VTDLFKPTFLRVGIPRNTVRPPTIIRPPTEGGEASRTDLVSTTWDSSGGDFPGETNPLVIPLPTFVPGDLMCVGVGNDTGSASFSGATPAGWEEGALSDATVFAVVYWRVMQSGDPTTVSVETSPGAGSTSGSIAWVHSGGVDWSTKTPDFSVFATNDPPQVSMSHGETTYDLYVFGAGVHGSGISNISDPPTGYTELEQRATGAADVTVYLAHKRVTSASTEDPDAPTITVGTWRLATVAILALETPAVAAGDHTHVEADITDLAHTDADAIHDNVAGEIAAITAKATPVSGDFLVIEDSEASNAKKSITLADLPATSAALDDLTDVTITGTPADNEVVAYDTGTAEFINQTAAEAGLSATGHTHTESDVTDLDHWVEADHDALDHTGLTGVGGAMVIFGAEPQSDGSLRFLYGVDASGRPTYTAAGTADTLAFVIQQSDGRYAVREV